MNMPRKPVDLRTFGCRLNSFESEVMRGHAEAAGLTDTIVFNTCAVTAEAERQARQAIRKARRENPAATIVVTGCAAQIDPARFAAMAEVDRVLGNEEKLDAGQWTPALETAPVTVADIMAVRDTAPHLINGFDGRSRAFVQIQQGCDHRCTFCIIPYGRGNNRSLPLGAIVDQVRALVAGGYREVVLTGVDIASYGGDLPGRPGLANLVRRLLALVPDLARLRFSSLDPTAFDDDLVQVIADEPRVMPHLHLSLQAGHDLILKRMKRRHLTADVTALLVRLRAARPGLVFGADVIAGFPTESAAMHAQTLAHLAAWEIPFLHVFPYSPRPGTPAARMPQVAVETRRRRAKDLRDLGGRLRRAHGAGQIGRIVTVLAERADFGHADDFTPVTLRGGARPGALVRAKVTGTTEDGVAATIADDAVAA